MLTTTKKKPNPRFVILKGKDAVARAMTAVRKSQPPANATRDFDIDGDELYRPRLVDDSSYANAEAERLAQRMESFAGKVEEGTRRPVWATDNFLMGDGEWGQRPIKQYEIVQDPGIAPPKSQNYAPRGASGLVEPENFGAPKPGPKRAGDGYVLKRAGFWRGTTVHVPATLADAAHLAIQSGDRDALQEIAKAAGVEVSDADWNDLVGPARWHK